MTDQRDSNPVSIVELRAAIDRVQAYRKLELIDQIRQAVGFTAAERDAWKTAYQWRIGFTERWRAEDVLVRERDRDTWESEEKYGTDLIREFLRRATTP